LLSAFALGMPLALALSIIAAIFRQGATVHVVWTRAAEPHPLKTP
jgi:hypothetical protein